MIDSAIISVAGKGTRLGKLGKTVPKSLVPVAGYPLLWYELKNLFTINPDISVYVIHGHLGDQIEKFIATYPEFSSVTCVNQYEICGEDVYGTLIPFKAVRSLIQEKAFLSLHGDNLYSLRDLQKALTIDTACSYIGVYDVSKETGKHGSVFFNQSGLLTHIQHKSDPQDESLPSTIYNFSGLSVCNADIWQVVDTIQPAHNQEYRVTEAFLALPKVKRLIQEDGMLHLTFPEDVPKLEKQLNIYV